MASKIADKSDEIIRENVHEPALTPADIKEAKSAKTNKKALLESSNSAFGRALSASLSPRSPPQKFGATELGRILNCETAPNNLAFTLVVHKSTFRGRPFIGDLIKLLHKLTVDSDRRMFV
jgi:hypothetical protein